jgi:hypothetical protein
MATPSLTLYGRVGGTPLTRDEWFRFSAQAETLQVWAETLHAQAAARARKRNPRAAKDPPRDRLVVDVLLLLYEKDVAIMEANPSARGGTGVTQAAVDVVDLTLKEAGKAIGDAGTRRALRALVTRLWRGPVQAIIDHRRRVDAALLR